MRKRKIIVISIIILIIILVIPLPHSLERNIIANQINNLTNDIQQVYVTIKGTYYKSLILDDRYIGRFEVEGLDDIKREVSMRLAYDRETNMNLLITNEPVYRIIQKEKFKEFVICIPTVKEDSKVIWNNSHGITITTFNSMNDVLYFLSEE